MGWLRDLMVTSKPPIPSFGRLAARALEHKAWPNDSRIKARSLSTLFSKLDRGVELEWLRDRPAAQRALSEVMGRPWADLKPHLVEPAFTSDGRLLRLTDVRFARELDLAREELPPGIPPEVLTPAHWGAASPTEPRRDAAFWRAPSGSGRSLVGAWLSCRGLAQYVRVRQAADLERIPVRGPLFLELERDVAFSAENWAALRLGERPVCVAGDSMAAPSTAGDSMPPAPSTAAHATLFALPSTISFALITSPPLERILPELVDWISRRLSDEGHFDAARAQAWLTRFGIGRGLVRTLGDALGWLGVFDELAPRQLQGRSLDEIGEYFVARRLREVEAADVDTERVFLDLTEAAARTLLGQGAFGQGSLGDARGLDDWARLLRGPDGEAPDPSWFGAALGGKGGLSKEELRKLTRRLPPRAYQLVRALELAGLLSVRSDDEYVLTPRFLVRLLSERAESHALRLSPHDWGAALLRPVAAPVIFGALDDTLQRGEFGPVQQLLDALGEATEEPDELLAALEAACIVVALRGLTGLQLPEELASELTLEAARWVVPLGGRIEPRFVPHDGAGPFYRAVTWRLAWAILSSNAPHLPDELRPLGRGAALEAVVGDAVTFSTGLGESPFDRVSLALWLDRLAPSDAEHPSFVSRSLGRLLNGEPVTTRELDALTPFGGVASWLALARSRGVDEGLVFDALAPLALADGQPLASEDERVQREFWRRVEPKALARRLATGLGLNWGWLLPHQLASLAEQVETPLGVEAARFLPLSAAARRFEERALSAFAAPALEELARRDADAFASWLRRTFERGTVEELSTLFQAARAGASAQALDVLPPPGRLLAMPPPRLDAARRFLLDLVQGRDREAARASRLLGELEAGLRQLRFARRDAGG